MDIVYMASAVYQTNPLSAKFFIFFSEMLLALRLSNGSVLPPYSWSLPPIASASALVCQRLPIFEQRSGDGDVKIESGVGTSHASNFLRSVMHGEYPTVRVDSDNESCQEEDDDNDMEDGKYENEKHKKRYDGEQDDRNEDENKNDEDIDREKENEIPRSHTNSRRRSSPELSYGRNRSHSCTSNSNIGGTLIDALSAEGKDKEKIDVDGVEHEDGDENGFEKDDDADVDVEGMKHRIREEGDGEKDVVEEDIFDEDDDVIGEVNVAVSTADSGLKNVEPMSDVKIGTMDDDETIRRKTPTIKTISPHTSFPSSLHSPPFKISESLRFLSLQKSSSAVWDQHAGLYALMSLVHLYFTCCASDWNAEEGDVAIQMCQRVHAVVEKKARHPGTTDNNDVSETVYFI